MFVNDLVTRQLKYVNYRLKGSNSLEFYIVGDSLEITCTNYTGRAFEKPRKHIVLVPFDELEEFEDIIEEFVEALGND